MSDFFASCDGESGASVLERGMRLEEGRYAERRRALASVIALAVAGAILLGGGLVAFAAVRRPASQIGQSVTTRSISAKPRIGANSKSSKHTSSKATRSRGGSPPAGAAVLAKATK